MKKVFDLLKGDFKNISRDYMLLFILISPVIIGVLFKFLLPWLTEILKVELDFNLAQHYIFIMSFMVIMLPLIMGTLIGFIILEDRDQGILNYFAITPLSKRGYLIYRLSLSVIISFISNFFVLYLIGLLELKFLRLTPVLIMAALGAPMMAIFMGAFANNKVEGFAFSKGSGVLMLGPILAYIIESNWSLLLAFLPSYWVSQAFLSAYGELKFYPFYLLIGFTVHLVASYLLWIKFEQRID